MFSFLDGAYGVPTRYCAVVLTVSKCRASIQISISIAIGPTRNNAYNGAHTTWLRRNNISTNATKNTTTHCHFFDFTVVFGSVIMKNTKSWYIGPVIGATSANHGSPVIQLRKNANAKNDAT